MNASIFSLVFCYFYVMLRSRCGEYDRVKRVKVKRQKIIINLLFAQLMWTVENCNLIVFSCNLCFMLWLFCVRQHFLFLFEPNLNHLLEYHKPVMAYLFFGRVPQNKKIKLTMAPHSILNPCSLPNYFTTTLPIILSNSFLSVRKTSSAVKFTYSNLFLKFAFLYIFFPLCSVIVIFSITI